MTDQATLDKLEAGFQKLQAAADCKSLLKKHLTREVFDACKSRKTAMGATLLDVIQSGECVCVSSGKLIDTNNMMQEQSSSRRMMATVSSTPTVFLCRLLFRPSSLFHAIVCRISYSL